MTPEAVINRYLDVSQGLADGTADVAGFVRLLATDADLLGRWLTLLQCPARPSALIEALSAYDPVELAQLAEAQAWVGAPISGSARLSMEQWRSALGAAGLGQLLADRLKLDDPEVVGWQFLLAISGFNVPHDPAVEEIIEFRGTAPALLEDADELLKIFAVVDALELQDVGAASDVARQLLAIKAEEFRDLVTRAEQQTDARIAELGLADAEEDDWAERLWARQQVSLLGRLFAQAQDANQLYTAHGLASRNLFDYVPYLLIVDPKRQALVPAGAAGVGILMSSSTSAIARSLRERVTVELLNEANQAVADRQVLRRLGAREGACVPLFAGEQALGALAFRVEDDVDHEFLMRAYSNELARWLAVLAAPGDAAADRLERYRERESKRLREIVHEANNPLSIVHNYLHILELRLQHEPAATEQLQMIGTELKRAGEIFQRARELPPLLDESEAAAAAVAVTSFDVNEIARRALELHQGYAHDHSVMLQSELAAGEVTVTSDEHRLSQVLNNLLRNAIEACSGASVAVASSPGVFRGGREGVELAVVDTGPGLPRSVVEKLLSLIHI